jgi:protein-disulfide isomerase
MIKKILPAVAAVTVALGGAWWMSQPAEQSSFVSMAEAQTADPEVDTSVVQEMTQGDPDAPITVYEYASFTCPHCANFHTGTFPQIKENYIDTGLVYYISREVYFDAYGLWAGMVARCAGEERYHGIVEVLYQTQADWAQSSDGAEVAENLRRIGRLAGMDTDQINVCLEDRETALAMMTVYRETATADDIRGTPSFIVNGEPFSNGPYEDFVELFDGLLEE